MKTSTIKREVQQLNEKISSPNRSSRTTYGEAAGGGGRRRRSGEEAEHIYKTRLIYGAFFVIN
jgi:hypothetical protein